MATSQKIGPYGCDEGEYFDIDKPAKKLLEIEIWSNDGHDGIINAISFKYQDGTGGTNNEQFGHNKTGAKHSITIGEDEYLTVLSGYYSPCINSLTFSTSKSPPYYGPYGKNPNNGDTNFSIDAGNDSIVAFFGRCDSQIRAIGAYVGPRA